MKKLPHLEDDGLIVHEVAAYAEKKYKLVWYFTDIFASSMKNKWPNRVYIDLFAGPGRSRFKETEIIVPASPMLALNITVPFSKYIFCENDELKMTALETRAKEICDKNVVFIKGDINKNIDKVLAEVPYDSLSFCFIDPYNLKDFNFQIVHKLAIKKMDFLILIPSFMDAHRNVPYYFDPSNEVLSNFTGDPNWRGTWGIKEREGKNFGAFVAETFTTRMNKLGFLTELDDIELILSSTNSPLYHLAFFSKSKVGMKFWKEARKYSSAQGDLFL